MSVLRIFKFTVSCIIVVVGIVVSNNLNVIFEKKLSLTVHNSGDKIAVCWISKEISITDIIDRDLKGCYIIGPNGDQVINSFIGHQFAVIPHLQKNRNNSLSKYFTVHDGLNIYNVGDASSSIFDHSFWAMDWRGKRFALLAYRRFLQLAFGCFLGVFCLLFDKNTETSSRHALKSSADEEKRPRNLRQPLIPRHDLKLMAIVMMLLNHIGRLTIVERNTPLNSLLVVGADAGLSSSIFMWLVGINISAQRRSSNLMLVYAYLFLHISYIFIKPIFPIGAEPVFEALPTVLLTGHLISTSVFAIDPKTGKCIADSDIPVLWHAFACVVVLLLIGVIGSVGLGFIHNVGVLYAIAGRLYTVGGSYDKILLWLGAATSFTAMGLRASIGAFTPWSLAYTSYITAYMMILIFQLVILCNPFDMKIRKKSLSISPLVCKYALHIYVGHLILIFLYKSKLSLRK
jgi:hypothetical protein